MTEKEKMTSGQLFNVDDPQLTKDRAIAKKYCYDYNRIPFSKTKKQEKLLKSLLGKTNGWFMISAPFWCDYGYNIEVGDNFYMNHNCVILDGAKVIFGDNVFIGPNCGFYTAGHPLDAEQRNTWMEFSYPITVGNNVWIGGGVQVMPGVTIGNNTVIGGGSVVTKDIPSGVMAAGNPCRVLREITEADKMEMPDMPL